MASWMVHFRIADGLLEEVQGEVEKFIVGNIGPDCGEPNEDWSKFSPPTDISHWMRSNTKESIDSDAFYERYLKDKKDTSGFSFYLGYYVHLLTDILWKIKIHQPTKEKYLEQFQRDDKFIWVVKEDWYDLDHKYLRDHPEFRTFRIFDKITTFPNTYLDYYSEVAIENQIGYISQFYNTFHGDLDREYPYLDQDRMDAFVTEALGMIREDLRNKDLL